MLRIFTKITETYIALVAFNCHIHASLQIHMENKTHLPMNLENQPYFSTPKSERNNCVKRKSRKVFSVFVLCGRYIS